MGGQRQGGTDHIWPDRQFAGIQVEQADQGDAGRAAVVEQFVERRADGTTAHQHVIHQHQVLAFDLERQVRGTHLGVQAILAEVVAVEGHVQGAEGGIVAQFFEQRLGNPDAPGTDADEAWLGNGAPGQMGAKVDGHLPDQFGGIG
ncbi:hypothetical protein D9M73_164200 [compost metagenome]